MPGGDCLTRFLHLCAPRAVGKLRPQFSARLGRWCNGNTAPFGGVIHGSNPCRPANLHPRNPAPQFARSNFPVKWVASIFMCCYVAAQMTRNNFSMMPKRWRQHLSGFVTQPLCDAFAPPVVGILFAPLLDAQHIGRAAPVVPILQVAPASACSWRFCAPFGSAAWSSSAGERRLLDPA